MNYPPKATNNPVADKRKTTMLVSVIIGVLIILCLIGLGLKWRHDKWLAQFPIYPGAEKTREVYMHMTPEDSKRDAAYGSTYASLEEAQAALKTNPHDAKAHRTIARVLVHQLYKNPKYLNTPMTSPQWLPVKRSLLNPVVTEYKEALSDEPDNPVTKYDLAAAYAQMDEWDKALPLYQQIESYPPLAETGEIAIKDHQRSIAVASSGNKPSQ